MDKDQQMELERRMTLPYRIELIRDMTSSGWFVQIPALRGCMSQGDTPDEAIEMIEEAQRLWLQVALEDGRPIPDPEDIAPDGYSGRFNVRVPRHLHHALVEAAREEGVSLNLFVATSLAQAVASPFARPPAHKDRALEAAGASDKI